MNDIKRFQKFIELDLLSGCWLWIGGLNHDGYGKFRDGKKTRGAHRVSYEYWHGEIREGLEIDHLCRNRNCVNPDHLELVTRIENARRGRSFSREKTHCPHGHEYNEENTYINNKTQFRYCRTCLGMKQL